MRVAIFLSNAPPPEVELSGEFNSEECKKLVSDLSKFANDYQRVIVVPRPGMDARIAVTAWRRILKMDGVEKEQIKSFINAFHNKGPEKTVE